MNAPPVAPLLLSVRDAARLLGVSPRHLHTLTHRGEVPHVRLGHRVLYPVARLMAYIEAQTIGGGR